jgi:hypothetical protein
MLELKPSKNTRQLYNQNDTDQLSEEVKLLSQVYESFSQQPLLERISQIKSVE